MHLEIRIRGVYLLVRQGQGVEILFPNGEDPPIKHGNDTMKHVDDTGASPHFAGLQTFADAAATAPLDQEPLKGKTVTIPHLEGSPFVIDSSLAKVVPLNEVANDGKKDLTLIAKSPPGRYWRRVATRIEPMAGTLRALVDSKQDWKFKKEFNTTHGHGTLKPLPLEVRLEFERDSLQIEISPRDGAASKFVTLDGGKTIAYLHNFDTPWPTRGDLDQNDPCSDTSTELEDDDFKWIYQILEDEQDDLEGWRASRRLPAPITMCGAATGGSAAPAGAPRVSSCFGSVWQL